MFELGQDQASGLRRLFARAPLSLLPVACVEGHAADRIAAVALAEALEAAGRRPVLIDLFGNSRLLDAGSGPADLIELAASLYQHGSARGLACDTIVVAADPLRLADLVAGLTDRMLLITPVDDASLERAYAQVKAVGLAHGLSRHLVAVRGAGSREHALAAYRRLADTAARYLDARVDFGGMVGARTDDGGWAGLAGEALNWVRPLGEHRAPALN